MFIIPLPDFGWFNYFYGADFSSYIITWESKCVKACLNYNLRRLMLDKRELSKLALFDEIRRESEISTSDKTLNESLMSLLKENEIYINDL